MFKLFHQSTCTHLYPLCGPVRTNREKADGEGWGHVREREPGATVSITSTQSGLSASDPVLLSLTVSLDVSVDVHICKNSKQTELMLCVQGCGQLQSISDRIFFNEKFQVRRSTCKYRCFLQSKKNNTSNTLHFLYRILDLNVINIVKKINEFRCLPWKGRSWKTQQTNNANKLIQHMAMVVTLAASTASNSLEFEQTSEGTNTGKYINQSGCRCTIKQTTICQLYSDSLGSCMAATLGQSYANVCVQDRLGLNDWVIDKNRQKRQMDNALYECTPTHFLTFQHL